MRARGGFSFVFTGLLLGLAVGLVISLVVSPVKYSNISPALLGSRQKDLYRGLIATSYNARGDLGRAKARVALLQDEDSVKILAAQAQQTVAQGGLAQEARGLALLAAAMNNQIITLPTEAPATATSVSTAALSTPTLFPTLPPLVTGTPEAETTITPEETEEVVFPTLAITENPGDPYVLKDRNSSICDVELSNILQVFVIDKNGKPLPGVEAIVTWQDGEDHFFTGMKPDIDLGYADFTLDPEITYNLRLTNGGETASKIKSPNCKLDSGMEYKGGVKLVFSQP